MKNIVRIGLTLSLMGLAAPKAAPAEQRKVGFSLSLGACINIPRGEDYDRAWLTLDIRSRFRLGRSFELVPEIMGAATLFGPWWLYPGALLNISPGRFFFGAGAVLPISYTDHSFEAGPPAPKVNVGYRGKRVILTAYFVGHVERASLRRSMNVVGLSLGYCF